MSNLVKPKRELAKRFKTAKIVNKIVVLLNELPSSDIAELKQNPELIKYICNLVENAISKKYEPDKKKIVLEILSRLVPNVNDADRKNVGDIIEFLHGNGDIKKIRLLKILGHYSIYFLKKFVL